MQLGDILYWETEKIIGYDTRWKYHVYLGDGNFRLEGNVFFFINKANGSKCFEITQADYPFFSLDKSYVGCTGLVAYSDAELAEAKPEHKGRLSDAHLKALCQHIAGCDTMTGWETKLAYEHLKAKL